MNNGIFTISTGAGFLSSTVLKVAVRSVSSGYSCVLGRVGLLRCMSQASCQL